MAICDNCRYVAFLYENDRTHFDKPGCLKWHGSWPNKWDCPEDCKDYEEMKINIEKRLKELEYKHAIIGRYR